MALWIIARVIYQCFSWWLFIFVVTGQNRIIFFDINKTQNAVSEYCTLRVWHWQSKVSICAICYVLIKQTKNKNIFQNTRYFPNQQLIFLKTLVCSCKAEWGFPVTFWTSISFFVWYCFSVISLVNVNIKVLFSHSAREQKQPKFF